MTGTDGLHRDGTLSCPCWCGLRLKRLPALDVRRGQTWSCSPECQRLGEEYLAERAA